MHEFERKQTTFYICDIHQQKLVTFGQINGLSFVPFEQNNAYLLFFCFFFVQGIVGLETDYGALRIKVSDHVYMIISMPMLKYNHKLFYLVIAIFFSFTCSK